MKRFLGWASGLFALLSLSGAVASPAPGGDVDASALDRGATHSEAPPATLERARLDAEARAPAVDVRLAPSPNGVLGAWLVAGPFRAAGASPLSTPPAGVDEKKLTPALGATVGGARDLGDGKSRPPARWSVVSSGPSPTGASQDPGREGSRSIDLKATLDDARGSELVVYAAGTLHIEKTGRYLLLLGVDDGVRVTVDGNVVLARDDARPLRDDDDVIALELTAGDHEVLLKLHQRAGAWVFRAKLVDTSLKAPEGAYLALPGTTADDARSLAARMSWLIVDRAFDARSTPPRYRPVLTVRWPEGAPRGVALEVGATLTIGAGPALFDVRAGGAAMTAAGTADFEVSLPAVEPFLGTATIETRIAGRTVTSTMTGRPQAEQALVRVERALARVKGDEPWLRSGSMDSVRNLVRRLVRHIGRGDGDGEAQALEARELEQLAENLERNADPYEGRTGIMRRAVVTPLDDAPSELGLYIPPSYPASSVQPSDPSRGGKRYPLVIGLHGMNSYPMSMMRALFGMDDEKKEPAWKDRHPVAVPNVEAFVITPYAHGNTMYREIGEDDVLHMMRWASEVFPIDPERITVTGPSMGGIGSASLPFHYPHVFAAAAPLCGYHSYVIRADIASRPKRPWERLLLEERSNVYWAENGEHLPLWIVHGTRDLPEANSGVLIDRYEKLSYPIKHEHPDAGHNVWGITYGQLKGMNWLLSQRLDPHPSRVRFRTMRTRYGTSAWVSVDELATETSWADVDARVRSRSSITMTSSGVAAMTLRRDEKLLEPQAPITVIADGTTLAFDEDEPLVLHRTKAGSAGVWAKGPPTREGSVKRGRMTGPIRDVFHDPILFVYAAGEEEQVNRRVVLSFADRPGIPTSYPVMSDVEFLAAKQPLAHERALFLVGKTNRVLAALESAAVNVGAPFPIQVTSDGVTIGGATIRGREVGAAFIRPNPLRPDRYVVVVAGADVTGTLRALALPDLLPDFVVWDADLMQARGQLLVGAGSLRAGGFFRRDWSLPAEIADPLRKTQRRAPVSDDGTVNGAGQDP